MLWGVTFVLVLCLAAAVRSIYARSNHKHATKPKRRRRRRSSSSRGEVPRAVSVTSVNTSLTVEQQDEDPIMGGRRSSSSRPGKMLLRRPSSRSSLLLSSFDESGEKEQAYSEGAFLDDDNDNHQQLSGSSSSSWGLDDSSTSCTTQDDPLPSPPSPVVESPPSAAATPTWMDVSPSHSSTETATNESLPRRVPGVTQEAHDDDIVDGGDDASVTSFLGDILEPLRHPPKPEEPFGSDENHVEEMDEPEHDQNVETLSTRWNPPGPWCDEPGPSPPNVDHCNGGEEEEVCQQEEESPRSRLSRALAIVPSQSLVRLNAAAATDSSDHPEENDEPSPQRRRPSSQALVLPPSRTIVRVTSVDCDSEDDHATDNDEEDRRRTSHRVVSQALQRRSSHSLVRTDSSSTLDVTSHNNNTDLAMVDGSSTSLSLRRRQQRRRSSRIRSSDDSVSTMDTDVDLDVDLGLVSSSTHQQLLCLEDDASYDDDSSSDDDDDSSSYDSDASSETEISLSHLALPASRRGGGGGVILADVLALPRSSSSPPKADDGSPLADRRLLTLSASTDVSRYRALPASGTEAPSTAIVTMGRGGTKKTVTRRRPKSPVKQAAMHGKDETLTAGALVVRQCDALEKTKQEDNQDANNDSLERAMVSKAETPVTTLSCEPLDHHSVGDEENGGRLLIDPMYAPNNRSTRSASVTGNELSLLLYSSSRSSLQHKKKRRRRSSKRRQQLLAAAAAAAADQDGYDLDHEIVEVGDRPIISNMDLIIGGTTTQSSKKSKPTVVERMCIDKKHRQRLKNARLVLRVVLGSGRKDFKTSRACFEAIDQVVAFKNEMMMVVQEVARSSQVLEDVKQLWTQLLKRGNEPLIFPMLPAEEQSWDAYETSLHLVQQIQQYIHPTANTKTSENTYTKIADFSVSESLPQDEADTTILGFVDGLPVRLTIGGMDSRASTRSRLTPYKYDRHLPLSLQDALRVVRCILGPSHKRVSGSDCLRSIQMYALLQIQFKRVSKQLTVERMFFQQLNRDMKRLCESLDSASQDRSPEAIRAVASQIQRMSKVLKNDC